MKIVKTAVLTFFLAVFLIPQSFNLTFAQQINSDPAKRILREFNRLETQLGGYMRSAVLGAPNLDAMNRAIDEFMRENPAVKRIIRTNNGGFTVNDVSTDSPPAPPRSAANQKWLQVLTVSKAPYYSLEADSQNAVSLFYAWPLFTGTDKSNFSGAFAAKIDIITHIALIEDIAPFQLAYNGNPFFQHEWDEADYDEEPLELKGTENLTIRTVKPIAARQAARQPVSPDSAALSSLAAAVTDSAQKTASSVSVAEIGFSDNGANNTNIKKSKSGIVLLKSVFQIFIILFILVIAVTVVVLIYRVKNRASLSAADGRFFMGDYTDEKSVSKNTAQSARQLFMNTPALKEPVSQKTPASHSGKEPSAVKKPLPIKEKEPSSAKVKKKTTAFDGVDDDSLPPQPVVPERVKVRNAAHLQQLKKEFLEMENKISALSEKIRKLEGK